MNEHSNKSQEELRMEYYQRPRNITQIQQAVPLRMSFGTTTTNSPGFGTVTTSSSVNQIGPHQEVTSTNCNSVVPSGGVFGQNGGVVSTTSSITTRPDPIFNSFGGLFGPIASTSTTIIWPKTSASTSIIWPKSSTDSFGTTNQTANVTDQGTRDTENKDTGCGNVSEEPFRFGMSDVARQFSQLTIPPSKIETSSLLTQVTPLKLEAITEVNLASSGLGKGSGSADAQKSRKKRGNGIERSKRGQNRPSQRPILISSSSDDEKNNIQSGAKIKSTCEIEAWLTKHKSSGTRVLSQQVTSSGIRYISHVGKSGSFMAKQIHAPPVTFGSSISSTSIINSFGASANVGNSTPGFNRGLYYGLKIKSVKNQVSQCHIPKLWT